MRYACQHCRVASVINVNTVLLGAGLKVLALQEGQKICAGLVIVSNDVAGVRV